MDGSDGSRARPVLTRLLGELTVGDVLVVVRLDRLARSDGHPLPLPISSMRWDTGPGKRATAFGISLKLEDSGDSGR
jgi:hypothetical protein